MAIQILGATAEPESFMITSSIMKSMNCTVKLMSANITVAMGMVSLGK